jgi:hypothetical protein
MPGAASVEPVTAAFGFDLTPRDGGADIQFYQALTAEAEVTLLDALGRPLQTVVLSAGTRRHSLRDVRQGAFLISIVSGAQRTTHRWFQR